MKIIVLFKDALASSRRLSFEPSYYRLCTRVRDVKREGKTPGAPASRGDPPLGGGEGDFQRQIIGERDRRRERRPRGSGKSHSPLWLQRVCGS